MTRQRVVHACAKDMPVVWSPFQPGFGKGRAVCNRRGGQVVATKLRDVTCERCKTLSA